MKQFLLLFTIIASFFLHASFFPVFASTEESKIGVHILNTSETDPALKLLNPDKDDRWHYVTIPYTLDDVKKTGEWQDFFNKAKEQKVIPLVRLTSKFEDGAWKVPTRKDLIVQIDTLAKLTWPTDKKHIMIYNEVNHSKEWGGTINPEEYARIFEFSARWAHTSDPNFIVMPAAMDLAAPNGRSTMEAFTYLTKMYEYNNEIFTHADAWNSHSYPNPAFSAPPTATGKNSLRGFEHELTFLEGKTTQQLEVYITETGWETNGRTQARLPQYYEYAIEHVWSHPKVRAVTPFILKGSPGPFAGFSFVDGSDNPTAHYTALQSAMERVESRRTAAVQ